MGVVDALDIDVAAFLAALLIASAIHKALDHRRMTTSVSALVDPGGGAGRGLSLLGLTGVAELTAGLALLPSATRPLGAVAAAALWAVYGALIVRALMAGRSDIDCGCAFGRRGAPLGGFELGRNLALITLALATAIFAGPGAVGALEGLTGLGLLTLYVALEQVSASAALT
jgi:hypothetical protein